jgi:hypothetical protein
LHSYVTPFGPRNQAKNAGCLLDAVLKVFRASEDSSASRAFRAGKKAPQHAAGEPFRNSISNSLLLLFRLGSLSLLGWLLGSTWLAASATFSCQFAHLPQRQNGLTAKAGAAEQPLAAQFCTDYIGCS